MTSHMGEKSGSAWESGACRVPMWMGGAPAGHCGEKSFGPQLPERLLYETRCMLNPPFSSGPCCPMHGGPREGEPIVFRDGYTPQGRPMWCAVMPDFINLQESPSGFSGDAVAAVANLRAELARATGEQA